VNRTAASACMTTSLDVLRRETFVQSRAAEFFQLQSLQAQTGQPADKLDAVVVKELMDNALDAAESVDGHPEISLTVGGDDQRVVITVTDNGPGMAPELIDQVLDFSVLVSDKAAYRSPTRGLQGNALKTIIGIPTALGSHDPVIIESRGIRHTIAPSIDPAGEVHIDHAQAETEVTPGTVITVTVPLHLMDTQRWAQAFALVNPHAQITTYLGHYGEPPKVDSYKPTVGDDWSKPLPTDPTSAHWYTTEDLERLVFAHVNRAKRGGRDLPIGEFVRSFLGLSSTVKAKKVCAEVDDIEHLSDFEDHRELVNVLLRTMQAEGRAPKPAALGQVPEDHYRTAFEDWYGVRRFWFKRATVMDGSVPWVMEVAIAETEDPGDLFYGINYSPSFDDPLARLPLAAGDLCTTGAASFLAQMDAYPDGIRYRAAAIHVISPGVSFLDKGKTTLAVPR
jgi:DNA topoisomerase VI subunit B